MGVVLHAPIQSESRQQPHPFINQCNKRRQVASLFRNSNTALVGDRGFFLTASLIPYPIEDSSRKDCTFGLNDAGRFLAREFRFVSRVYPPDTVIIHQGDRDTRAFLVESGWGRLCKDLPGGEQHLIDVVVAGDVVGLCGSRFSGSDGFSSITTLRAWVGPAAALRAFSTAAAPSACYVSDAMDRQRAVLTERLADMGQRKAAVRTAHFLLELGERLELAGAATREEFLCPLTQNDLASALGLTGIHVNRMLREAREFGLYEFHRGKVRFIDYKAAVNFAVFDPSYLIPR